MVRKQKMVLIQRHSVRVTQARIHEFREEIEQCYDSNGYLSWSTAKKKYVILGTSSAKGCLVQCPECKFGHIQVVRSPKTKKRFLGCTNYSGGCSATAPLLQRARLRALKQACVECGWPIIIFRYSRKQKWSRQCPNQNCSTRAVTS